MCPPLEPFSLGTTSSGVGFSLSPFSGLLLFFVRPCACKLLYYRLEIFDNETLLILPCLPLGHLEGTFVKVLSAHLPLACRFNSVSPAWGSHFFISSLQMHPNLLSFCWRTPSLTMWTYPAAWFLGDFLSSTDHNRRLVFISSIVFTSYRRLHNVCVQLSASIQQSGVPMLLFSLNIF